jgi:hypothetical protein
VIAFAEHSAEDASQRLLFTVPLRSFLLATGLFACPYCYTVPHAFSFASHYLEFGNLFIVMTGTLHFWPDWAAARAQPLTASPLPPASPAVPGTPQYVDEQFLSRLFLFVALVIMFWLLIA